MPTHLESKAEQTEQERNNSMQQTLGFEKELTEQNEPKKNWKIVIKPTKGLFDLNLIDLWYYRDLLKMFVKRNVVTVYKQTILGPLWYLIQPVLTTLMYTLIFGKIADISSDGLPRVLFYLSGIVIWNYFSETFGHTSKTFHENENIFGKVYFPRLIMPISAVISGLIKFAVQFGLFLLIFAYFLFTGNEAISPNWQIVLLPFYLFLMAGFSVGAGIIFTSLTTKYRDLQFLLQFGIQLLMYGTPIIYPVSTIPDKYKPLILANPFTPIVESMRYSFLGTGYFSWGALAYSFVFMVVLLLVGLIVFNRTEKNFMDTV